MYLSDNTHTLSRAPSRTHNRTSFPSLSVYFQVFDTISSFFDVYKVETIGDAYMIAGGITGNIRYTSTPLHAHILKMQSTHVENAFSYRV
jgi:hypothetical protein